MSVLDSEDEIEEVGREMVEVAKVQYVLFTNYSLKNNSAYSEVAQRIYLIMYLSFKISVYFYYFLKTAWWDFSSP